MPNTITAYNTFVSGTKARSAQVNTNFSNHRGTIVPISPSSAIAESHTHDVGSSEYYWKDMYAEALNLGLTLTASSSPKITADTIGTMIFHSDTDTGFVFRIGDTSTGDGLPKKSLISVGQQLSGELTAGASFVTTTSTPIPSSTATIQTVGRPVELRLISSGAVIGQSGEILIQSTSTSGNLLFDISFVRSGSTLATYTCGDDLPSGSLRTLRFPVGMFSYIDTSAPAGSLNYWIESRTAGTTSQVNIFRFRAVYLLAREL